MSSDDVIPLPEHLAHCAMGCPGPIHQHSVRCADAIAHEEAPREFVEGQRRVGISWQYPMTITDKVRVEYKLDPVAYLRKRMDEYIAFVPDYEDSKLEEFLAKQMEQNFTGVDLLYGDRRVVREDSEIDWDFDARNADHGDWDEDDTRAVHLELGLIDEDGNPQIPPKPHEVVDAVEYQLPIPAQQATPEAQLYHDLRIAHGPEAAQRIIEALVNEAAAKATATAVRTASVNTHNMIHYAASRLGGIDAIRARALPTEGADHGSD